MVEEIQKTREKKEESSSSSKTEETTRAKDRPHLIELPSSVKNQEIKPTPIPLATEIDQLQQSLENLEIEGKIKPDYQNQPEISEIAPVEERILDPDEFYIQEFNKLPELEQKVLRIAEEVLKKKRYDAKISTEHLETSSALVQELHSVCVSKLTYTKGFSEKAIFEAIQNLEDNAWIVTAQRRTKKEILESDPLMNVLDFIKEHPGTHARDERIEEKLGISRNPFTKHTLVLEAFGFIRSKKIGRTLNYFYSQIPEIFDDFVVLFQNELIVQILQIFLNDPARTMSSVADELGVYHGAIQYHLKKLAKMDLLKKEKTGNNIRYIINRNLLKRYNMLFRHPPFDL